MQRGGALGIKKICARGREGERDIQQVEYSTSPNIDPFAYAVDRVKKFSEKCEKIIEK